MCSHAFMVHGPLPRMHPFQPRNFFGGQSSGPAGSDPGSFRPPMGISHPAVVLFYHKTARFVLSLFTRGGQVRTLDHRPWSTPKWAKFLYWIYLWPTPGLLIL